MIRISTPILLIYRVNDKAYWWISRYENDNRAARFTEQQLAEIRKTTLSKILCDNFDVASDIQRAAFDLPSNFLSVYYSLCDYSIVFTFS